MGHCIDTQALISLKSDRSESSASKAEGNPNWFSHPTVVYPIGSLSDPMVAGPAAVGTFTGKNTDLLEDWWIKTVGKEGAANRSINPTVSTHLPSVTS